MLFLCHLFRIFDILLWSESFKETEMNYYLISTDHLSDGIWFRDDEDFTIGMNHVAVLASHKTVFILCFVLMSNHVHFVIGCDNRKQALEFVTQFKNIYSRYYGTKYQVTEFLRRNKVDIRLLPIEEEALEKAIAYVLMNPVAANICTHAALYPWGSGSCYFRDAPVTGQPIRILSRRKQCALLKSNVKVEQNYCISPSGYILPESYICIPFVEKIFRTAGRLNFFLNNSSKAKARFEADSNLVPSFRDQLIASAIGDICHTLFHKRYFDECNNREKARMAYELQRRFSADPKQIARVLGCNLKDITLWLDSV